MAGLYVWQTNLDGRRQNDAFLFGGGIEYSPSKLRIQVYGTGYLGYMNNTGDKPVLLRAAFEQRGKRINGVFKFQQGIHDFDYTSIEAGLKYGFKK